MHEHRPRSPLAHGAPLLSRAAKRPDPKDARPSFRARRSNAAGLVDSLFSLIVPASANAFGTLLSTGFFQAVPKEIEEAAVRDGRSRMGVLARIGLPLTRPGLVTAAVFTLVASWHNVFRPLVAATSDHLPLGCVRPVGRVDPAGRRAGSRLPLMPRRAPG